jgi:ribonuclease HI
MIKLNTDAATLGNPGPAGVGILIVANGQQDQTHLSLPVMSNHEAEFAAAIAGFKRLQVLNLQGFVSFASDSKLVIQSLDKRYAKHYQAQVDELLTLIDSFDQVIWQWVPERENRGAHMLAQQGLHAER